jgi:transcriptional regulator with XRE-family HTH domain
MSQSNYSKIESDKNESVSWEVLPTVADLYNIDIVDLLGDLGVKNINLSKNNDYATNAFYVIQQPNMPESIIKTLQELVESQRLMIETLKLQLEILSKNRG